MNGDQFLITDRGRNLDLVDVQPFLATTMTGG